ncbi:MAG: outer membrane beta-barrel protein [Bacteroidales bacterium]|nr:outer membrane beta-barrel protein [Bacteroidales bacterium]
MKRFLRNFILIISVVTLTLSLNAQTDNSPKAEKNKSTENPAEKKPEIIRDRLMVDLFHAFWLGMPKEVSSMKFNPGFNVTALWDFKLPNNSPLSFGLGVGFSYYSQFTNALFKSEDQDIMKYYIIPDGIKYKVNRVTYTNVHIPIEFRYRNPHNKFKVSIGARVGLVTRISHRYRGDDPSGSELSVNYKSFEVFHKQKYNVDVIFRMGWNCVGFYASYQINKLFESGKGPAINPITVGLTWSLF